MGKKRKGNDEGGFLFIFIILLIIVALVAPILIIVTFIYHTLMAAKIKKRLSGTMSDFWLNESEKKLFKQNTQNLAEVTNIIEQAIQSGLKAGISVNLDGAFSARSNLGKEIRLTLEKYEPMKDNLILNLSSLIDLPIKRWAVFNSHIENGRSLIMAFIAWLSSWLYFFLKSGKKNFMEILNPYIGMITNIFRGQDKQISITSNDYVNIGITTLIVIATYFISSIFFGNSGENYSPKPEKVSEENVDLY